MGSYSFGHGLDFYLSSGTSSIAPVYNIGGVWPPKAISIINTYTVPLTNTFFLLTSGATVTWAHHALLARAKKHTLVALIFTLILAVLFTGLQGLECALETYLQLNKSVCKYFN